MYKYPEKLVDYLTELESEGCEIFTTHSLDEVIWYVIYLDIKWLTIISWPFESDDFAVINIANKAKDRLIKVLEEYG